MKSIEERAKEYAYRLKSAEIGDFGIATVYGYKDVYNANIAAYKRGATEQKAIDEEARLKKCDDMTKEEYEREVAFADWYNKNGKGIPTYSDAIEWARRELIDEACEWLKENIDGGVHPSSAYGFVEKFRKANGIDYLNYGIFDNIEELANYILKYPKIGKIFLSEVKSYNFEF